MNSAKYAQRVHDAIPPREIYYKDRLPTTQYEMATGKKPIVRHFRVFRCPITFDKKCTFPLSIPDLPYQGAFKSEVLNQLPQTLIQ